MMVRLVYRTLNNEKKKQKKEKAFLKKEKDFLFYIICGNSKNMKERYLLMENYLNKLKLRS